MGKRKKYPPEVYEYIKVRCETSSNNTQIAKEIKTVFKELENKEVEAIRKIVSKQREKLKGDSISSTKPQPKRLFWDIETSPLIGWFWRIGKQYVNHNQIMKDKKIICISYKWQGEDNVHTLKWNKDQSDKEIVSKFIKVLGECDEAIAHNGDRFDIKELRTRAIQEGLLMFPKYRTLDTLKKSRKYFNFNSNKLDYIGEILTGDGKLEHEGYQMWLDVMNGDTDALKRMISYCERDVVLLEDVFHILSPYIDHNTNHAIQFGGEKYDCPNCASKNVSLCHTDTTPMGYIKRHMKCHDCKKQYPVSNRSYLSFLTK